MDKVIIEKIYTTLMSAALTFLLGFAIKKVWIQVTGAEPPDPEDPEVPARQAITWFIASGIGVGLAQLIVSRQVHKRLAGLRHNQVATRHPRTA